MTDELTDPVLQAADEAIGRTIVDGLTSENEQLRARVNQLERDLQRMQALREFYDKFKSMDPSDQALSVANTRLRGEVATLTRESEQQRASLAELMRERRGQPIVPTATEEPDEAEHQPPD